MGFNLAFKGLILNHKWDTVISVGIYRVFYGRISFIFVVHLHRLSKTN